MRKIKAVIIKMGVMVSSLAMVFGVLSVDAACSTWFHQPEVPQGMEKFAKRS